MTSTDDDQGPAEGRAAWRRLARAAIHEAGHACLAAYLGRRELLNSMALSLGSGWTELHGEAELEAQSVDLLLDRIAIALGGLAAESGLIGSPTAQSAIDVADATRLAAFLARRGLLPDGPVADLEVVQSGVGAAPNDYAMRAVLRAVGAAREEAAQAVVSNLESVRSLALQLLIAPDRRLEGDALRDAIAVSRFEARDAHRSDDDPLEVLRHVHRDFRFAWEAFNALMQGDAGSGMEG